MRTSDRLQALLDRLDLIEYADILRKEEIDDGNLHLLTEAYLRKIGIPAGPALQIMEALKGFQAHTERLVTCFAGVAAFGWLSIRR